MGKYVVCYGVFNITNIMNTRDLVNEILEQSEDGYTAHFEEFTNEKTASKFYDSKIAELRPKAKIKLSNEHNGFFQGAYYKNLKTGIEDFRLFRI